MKFLQKFLTSLFFTCALYVLPQHALALTSFEFLDQPRAAEVLSANDDYLMATADLERQAKARSAKPVSQEAYAKIMGATAKDWSTADRARIEAALPALEKFINQLAWEAPATLQFIRADAALEDNLPHTRGTAIVLPDSVFSMPRYAFMSMLAHEMFHILTRHNEKFKELSYQHLGFERCETVRLHSKIEQLKITNPETPSIDTTTGFIDKLAVRWLIVQREKNLCSLDADNLNNHSVAPQDLQGLIEKIGKNTDYLFHAEEILAENFAALFMAGLGGRSIKTYPSADLLNSLQNLWFTRK
jgi:hypothetical protein